MRRYSSVTMAVLVLALSSCNPSGSGQGSGGDEAPGEPEGGSEARTIPLTDERLDKYLRYRKEFNQSYAGWHKEVVGLAKSVESKSTDISKGLAAARGSIALGEKQEREIKALREKHGFTEHEDDRLSSAMSDVMAARALENPLMGDAFKTYRDMQAAGGDQKKAADEALKSLEDEEKEGLARAREKYGDACVEVLSRRVKELYQLQMDAMSILTGQEASEAK